MISNKYLIKYNNLWEELKLLGFNGSLYRIRYELNRKLRIKEWLEPANDEFKSKLPKGITYKQWVDERPAFFVCNELCIQDVLKKLLVNNEKQVIEKAKLAAEGKIYTFSKVLRDYGQPKCWSYNPLTQVDWPMTDHYSRTFRHESTSGDIKLVWELNRFPFVYDYARAYILTGDDLWKDVFISDVTSWISNNPYRKGPNWGNGQELAIRIIAVLYGLFVFGSCTTEGQQRKSFNDSFFNQIVQFMYTHGEYLETNIDYARKAVHNNHLIGEALGLYIIGMYFPWFQSSNRWKAKGQEILEKECIKQFYNDGGYCQNSHTYHRLALHYYLWYARIQEVNGESVAKEIKELLRKSYNLLLANMNANDGMLPNYGNNDGALLNPWTSCDYTDFRPILQALGYYINKNRTFANGLWDEELLWFFGAETLLDNNIEEDTPANSVSNRFYGYPHLESYPITGLHVFRNSGNDFLAFRCGSVINRFGQSDQLHVDLWWKGLNIAIDPGSYLYNDQIKFHNYFMSAMSHNTVTIDNCDHMLHYRRFKFLYWTEAQIINYKNNEIVGEHYGYMRLEQPYVHRRKIVSYSSDITIVRDSIYPVNKERVELNVNELSGKMRKFCLHWLLNNYSHQQMQHGNWQGISLQTPNGDYGVFVISSCDDKLKSNIFCGDQIEPKGWHSRYYSLKESAIDWELAIEGYSATFTTIFVPIKSIGHLEEINNSII